jgi:hypothetical protein
VKEQKKWIYLLLFCFIIETGSLTFIRNIAGKYISPLFFVMISIAWAYAGSKLTFFIQARTTAPAISVNKKIRLFIVYATVFAVVVFLVWLWLRSFFSDYPLDPSYSDIIPMIQRINYRFMHGQEIYESFNDFGYTAFPTYLPAMWMPFLAADKLQLDYRTWSYIILCVILLICTTLLPVKNKNQPWLFLFPFLIFLLYIWNQPSTLGWSVEPMIAGFYLLLLMGIYFKNAWIMGFALLLCMLSRYAILLWVPVLFILLFFFASKKRSIYTAIILLTGMLVTFIIPFFLSHPHIFEASYAQYNIAALGEWNGQSWQKPGDLPFQLSQGYGFAIYFYQWGKGEIIQRLKLAQMVHLIICIALPLATVLWYWLRKNKRLPLNCHLLFSLKLYLVFFFAFIQVPYAYLFLTPLLVSSLITILLLLHYVDVIAKE